MLLCSPHHIVELSFSHYFGFFFTLLNFPLRTTRLSSLCCFTFLFALLGFPCHVDMFSSLHCWALLFVLLSFPFQIALLSFRVAQLFSWHCLAFHHATVLLFVLKKNIFLFLFGMLIYLMNINGDKYPNILKSNIRFLFFYDIFTGYCNWFFKW